MSLNDDDDDNENRKVMKSRLLPTEFVDAHQHFIDTTEACQSFNSFVASFLGPTHCYVAADYEREVIGPIISAGIDFIGSVHVEAMPTNGLAEAEWVTSQREKGCVKAIVASLDLTRPTETVRQQLLEFQQRCPLVRGVRWILDVGDGDGDDDDAKKSNDQMYVLHPATHFGTKRHDVNEFGTIDYLKVDSFERGFSYLEEFQYSFDLQCAPCQLPRAAALLQKYPNVPVCIDHLGKLHNVLICLDDNSSSSSNPKEGYEKEVLDDKQLEVWKQNMRKIAQVHPRVHCKISMLGCVIPNWHVSAKGQALLKQLLHWVIIDFFGPQRCMAALNWHLSPSISDSAGHVTTGPSPVEWITLISNLLPEELSHQQRQDIFANNARRFYRFLE